MNPLASIVIPTYQRTQWLIECLQGLKNQNYPSDQFEVIVVDDSSPNALEKKEAVLSHTYPFKLTYEIQSKGGPAKARNLGISKALGKYILFTDDDAIPEPQWIQELVSTLATPNIAGVSGLTFSYKKETLIERYLDHVSHLSKHHFGNDGSLAYIITVNAGFNRDALKSINGFDESFPYPSGEDMDLGFRLRKSNNILGQNPNAIVMHRQRTTLTAMLKTWFIYGRGAYMCAVKNDAHMHKNVTSNDLKEFGKIKNTLIAYAKQMKNNFSNKQLTKMEAILFPHLEILNHIAYQAGRIYEHIHTKRQPS